MIGWWDSYPLLLILLLLNGSAQSLCWPCVGKVIGAWYPGSSRNVMFGILGVSASVGGIQGTVLAVSVIIKVVTNYDDTYAP